MTTGLRQCSKCNQLKPLGEYHKAKRGKDGLRAECRPCRYVLKKVEIVPENFKKCVICNEIKELHCFPLRKGAKDGHRGNCTICNKKRNFNYFLENKEKFYDYKKKWLKNNPEKHAISAAKWAKNNRPKLNKRDAERRAMELNATPPWLSAINLAQMQEMYDVALAKTVQTGIPYEVDHIHPLLGVGFRGLHVPWNLQVIPRFENRSKGNKLRHTQ